MLSVTIGLAGLIGCEFEDVVIPQVDETDPIIIPSVGKNGADPASNPGGSVLTYAHSPDQTVMAIGAAFDTGGVHRVSMTSSYSVKCFDEYDGTTYYGPGWEGDRLEVAIEGKKQGNSTSNGQFVLDEVSFGWILEEASEKGLTLDERYCDGEWVTVSDSSKWVQHKVIDLRYRATVEAEDFHGNAARKVDAVQVIYDPNPWGGGW